MSKAAKRHRSHDERKGQRKMQTRKGSHPQAGYKISEARAKSEWIYCPIEGFGDEIKMVYVA